MCNLLFGPLLSVLQMTQVMCYPKIPQRADISTSDHFLYFYFVTKNNLQLIHITSLLAYNNLEIFARTVFCDLSFTTVDNDGCQ